MDSPEDKRFEKYVFAAFVLVLVHGCQISSSINNLASAVNNLAPQKPAAATTAPTAVPATQPSAK